MPVDLVTMLPMCVGIPIWQRKTVGLTFFFRYIKSAIKGTKVNTLLVDTSACASETCGGLPPAVGTNPPALNVRLERGNAGKHPGIHLADSGFASIIAVSRLLMPKGDPHWGDSRPGRDFFNVECVPLGR